MRYWLGLTIGFSLISLVLKRYTFSHSFFHASPFAGELVESFRHAFLRMSHFQEFLILAFGFPCVVEVWKKKIFCCRILWNMYFLRIFILLAYSSVGSDVVWEHADDPDVPIIKCLFYTFEISPWILVFLSFLTSNNDEMNVY